MSKKIYEEWIENYILGNDIFRKCIEASLEMKNKFPELTIKKGLALFPDGTINQHQWLVDEENNIIDPTAKQWPETFIYREIPENSPEPISRCINCGNIIYENEFSSVCSDICHKEMVSVCS